MPKIMMPKSGGLFNSKIFKAAVGYATGGPVGAAVALAASNNPAIGRAMDVYGAAKGMSQPPNPSLDLGTNNETNISKQFDTDQNFAVPKIDSPISRRMSLMSQNPEMVLSAGLKELNNPDIPYEIRAKAAPYLFQAKHYGRQGGLT